MTERPQFHKSDEQTNTEEHNQLVEKPDIDHQAFLNQFPRNLGTNILLFLINVAAGIWLIPYFIHNLGVAAYGLIPLAMSLTHYVALVTLSISGGISRFLTIDLQQKNYERANRTFNTSFWMLLLLILAFMPILAIFTQYVPVLFKVPQDQITSSKWLFAGVILSFLVTTLSSCFTASAFAFNRLDLRNVGNIVRSIGRILFVVLLFILFKPSLENVAFATLLASLSGFAMHYYYWRRLTPELQISPSSFDKSRLKDLTTMGGWLVVNQVGYLLFLQIDLIVVNRLFGPTAGGEYASILQWSMLLRSMSGVLAGVIQPMFMISYAKGNTNDMIRISKVAVKFMGLGLALPIGLACGFSSELLTVWVGPEFTKLAPLMVLMLIHLTVNLAVTPLFAINVSYNKVKVPGIVTLVMGCINLALAILIPTVFKTGFYGIALAGAIVLTMKNAIFTPWYATHVMGIKSRTFFREMAIGIMATLGILGIGKILSGFVKIETWAHLIGMGVVIGMLYFALVWFLMMSRSERKLFFYMIKKKTDSNP